MKKLLIFLLTILCFAANATAQTKTITNADLEKYRKERLRNDPDDERERLRRNLPSREAEEQARQQRAAETNELANRIRAREAEIQNYWQTQAFELRSEIAAVEAQINYVRERVGEIPPPQTYYAVGYNPYFYSPTCCGSYGGAVASRTHIGGGIAFGNRPHVSIGAKYSRNIYKQDYGIAIGQNPAVRGNLIGRKPYNRPRLGYYGVLAVPFTLPTAQNLTREELLAQLRSLEQMRAGLYARYSVLEDEARKAGVKLD
jgi:DNA segregation ATPase FtsK/SpoIIIE-like protein